MLIQRKIEFDGDGGIFGTYWEDVELPTRLPNSILEWLPTLGGNVGTEYRIINSNRIDRAVIRQSDQPPRYAEITIKREGQRV